MFCRYGNNLRITKIEYWVFESSIYTLYICFASRQMCTAGSGDSYHCIAVIPTDHSIRTNAHVADSAVVIGLIKANG